jgi:hypothetical protein
MPADGTWKLVRTADTLGGFRCCGGERRKAGIIRDHSY